MTNVILHFVFFFLGYLSIPQFMDWSFSHYCYHCYLVARAWTLLPSGNWYSDFDDPFTRFLWRNVRQTQVIFVTVYCCLQTVYFASICFFSFITHIPVSKVSIFYENIFAAPHKSTFENSKS